MPSPVPYTGQLGGSLYEREESAHDNPTPDVRVSTPPDAFGVGIAEATQHLGQVSEDAGKELFDRAYAMQELKVHADVNTSLANATNAMQDRLVQYKQLEGKAAVDGLPSLQEDLDKIRSSGSQGMSPYGQQLYDAESRNQRGRLGFSGATYAADQNKVYEIGSAKAAVTTAIRDMSLNPDATAVNIAKINTQVDHMSDIQGIPEGDPQRDMARRTAVDTAYQTQIHAMARDDPIAAQKVYNAAIKSGALFSNDAMNLDATLKSMVADKASQDAALQSHSGVAAPGTTVPAGGGGDITSPSGLQSYKARVAQIESGSGKNEGSLASYYQFEPGTWAKYGAGGTRGTAQGEESAMNALTQDNRNALKEHLGREPTGSELYLAHQQGAQGAWQLLSQPSRRAGDIVGDHAVRSNGGDPNAPASDFVALWAAKFNGTKVPAGSGTAGTPSGTSTGGDVVATPRQTMPEEDANNRPLEDKIDMALANLHANLGAAGIPVTPEAEEKTVKATEALDAQYRRVRDDTIQRDVQTVNGAIWGGGNDQKAPSTLGTVTDLAKTDPKVAAAIDRLRVSKPEELNKIQDALNKNAKGDVPETPARLQNYATLKGMSNTDPQGFAQQDILGADLPMAWKKELIDLQAKGGGKAPADPNVAKVFAQPGVANQLQNLGIKPKTEEYNLLAAEVGDEITQFATDNKRQPNADERQEIVTRILQDKALSDANEGGILSWLGFGSTADKAKSDWMESAKAKGLAEKGYEPSQFELQRAWDRQQYQQKYGTGGAKKAGQPKTLDNSWESKANQIPLEGLGTSGVPKWGPGHQGTAGGPPVPGELQD
jgi:hypothetical protein